MPDPEAPEPPDGKKQRKKAEKAREAWITFAGRVIAQVVGAMASVGLGLLVVRQYQSQSTPGGDPAGAPPSAQTSPLPRPAARRQGAASIVVLPLANLSNNPDQEYFADGMTEALTASARTDRGAHGDLAHVGDALQGPAALDP